MCGAVCYTQFGDREHDLETVEAHWSDVKLFGEGHVDILQLSHQFFFCRALMSS